MIDKKTFIVANVCWAAVAVGAFVGGRSGKDELEAALVAASSKGAGSSSSAVTEASPVDSQAMSSGRVSDSDINGRVDGDKMEKLLGRAFREKNPLLRKQMLANLMANITPENVAAALAAFEAEPKSDEMDGVFRDFLYAWGLIDGEKALEYALNPDSPKKAYYGSVSAMTGWASKDMTSAKAFVEGREPGEQTAWLHYGVFKSMLDTDVQAAAEYATTNTKSHARGRAMDRLTERLMEDGGAGALTKWLDGIDHTGENDMVSYKTHAIRSVVDRLAKEDPEKAKEVIAANYGEPFVNFETLRHTAWRVGQGSEGMDWLASLPESKDRSRAFGEMVGHYANRDPNLVATWLNDRPESPEFDSAASIFAQQIVDDDPVSAVAWAKSIQTEESRDKTLRKVIKSWQKADSAAANAWLQDNS